MSLTDDSAQPRTRTAGTGAAMFKPMRLAGLAMALGLAAGTVDAVTIAPVLIELSPARKIVSVTVTNSADSAVSFQADVLTWSQPDGQDRFEETDDLMVVPPIAIIAAGASQIFRITPRTPPNPREQAYRLILEDVTPEAAGSFNSATVNIRVRHSLPVFVSPEGKPAIAVRVAECAAAAAPKGCVRLYNDGSRYVTAKALTIDAAGWHKEVPLGTRLLAGAWREWSFDLPANVAGPLSVKADTSAGMFAGKLRPMSR
jgi:fimbrial chaperone protein